MPHPSIWIATAPDAPFPALTADAQTDVVVIGGGITGITTALQLSRAGRSVIVLEARSVGAGTTGHSTGNLYAHAGDGLAAVQDKWGEEAMRLVARSRAAAVDRIEAITTGLGIECQFARRRFHWLGLDGSDETRDRLSSERDACSRAGFAAALEESSPLAFAKGPVLVMENQAQFHPLSYVRGLARRIVSERCRIFEDTPALEVDADEGIVRTANATVRARHIVMASHTPKGFNVVQTELGPYREYAVAAELATTQFPPGIFWTLESSRHSLRHFGDGRREFAMVIGERHKTGQEPDPDERFAALERYLAEKLSLSPATYRWSAQGYYPADGLPYIGRSAAAENLFVATGFAADGLTYGTVAAQVICDLIVEGRSEFAELYKPTRFEPVRAAKAFVKENADVVGEYLKDYLRLLNPESLENVAPGESRIAEVEGRRCGVHRTASGELIAVSPICTHLKCVVHWNAGESTWDCPCHGSRFAADGSVLEGPAIRPLAVLRIDERRAA